MRILVASNASYAPPRGGSTRSNLIWLAHLAAQGHACRVVCPAPSPGTSRQESTGPEGLSILSVGDLTRHSHVLADEIRDFQPDWILVSSEDVGHVLLREADHAAPGRLIYLAHTPQFFPFGHASWNPDPAAAAIVARARAVVVIGNHMAGYVREHCQAPVHVIHPPIYGKPPYPRFGNFGRGDVLMINPCEVKGIHIFAELARRFPGTGFAALAGWGTTSKDRELLGGIPNVRLLDTVANIDEVLSQACLLLMPSLWYEGFGLIVMEAMLRGLPVIASDSGGLLEAKQGTGFVIPVRPIERYEPVFDENHMPKPVSVEQDIEPWHRALETLLTDEAAYRGEAEQSREAALSYVSGLRVEAFEEMLLGLHPRSLRILLAQNSLYYPSHGGGDTSNRLLMEALASRGHAVRAVARIEKFGEEGHARLLADLQARGVTPDTSTHGAVRMNLRGVDVHTLTRDPQIRGYLAAQITEFAPDVIVTSTDDPAQLLFDVAMRNARARLVHLVRATIAVPFGPDSSHPDPARADALRHADGIVGVSEYVARYVRRWGALDAVHVPISLLEPGDYPNLGRFGNPYVLMVNPCAVKGIAIFVELARRMPAVRFAAVPTWGTNQEDLALLRSSPNITVLPSSDNIDDILRQTSVLLVPSVWAEARSRVIVEAMSRGIPVIASDIGGIPEAKLGVDYLVPINPIVHYKPAVDENMVPVPEVPPQDVGPWQQALKKLLADRAHYDRIAADSRRAALDYIGRLSVAPFEAFLERLVQSPKRALPPQAAARLSAQKQKLLALWVRKKAETRARNDWFPGLGDSPCRLFCFPHAGGGTRLYSGWKQAFPDDVSVCPVCLPGRETRASETPIDRMDTLVAAIAEAITPLTDRPFLLFGHSMGAAVAFELARALRSRGARLPLALLVSAARAPIFRLDHKPPPEPPEDEFTGELARLEGMPADVLANPELMRLAMPALRADARLYRNYVYLPGEPLTVPIVAYGGRFDRNVGPHHLAAWSEHTSAGFSSREFQGGHFFIQTAGSEFLEGLITDVTALIRPDRETVSR